MYADLHPFHQQQALGRVHGGREGARGIGREHVGEDSEQGQLGIDAEGGERYPEPDGDKTRMAMLLDCDFSGIARQIAMPSVFLLSSRCS